MELTRLSKFKLQLRTLITEVRELREKERASSDQLHNYLQKQKQSDGELRRKITELEGELASSNELCQKLERKVQFLEDDNSLLESKHKELKETISNILQSKEGFVKAYEDSTCEMRRSIESRDRKISMLSEKINAHLVSFDLIQKEASFVKQVVDNVQRVVNEKEEVVARLKTGVDKICTFENLFIGKINDLETKLRSNDNELRKKDRRIAELQTQLETAKVHYQWQSKIEELKKSVVMKEEITETLISENKALRLELGRLGITIKKIQYTMAHMDEEDKVAFSLMLVNQEESASERDKEDRRLNPDLQTGHANSHSEVTRGNVAEITVSPSCAEYRHISHPLRENDTDSCVSESACSPSNSVHSQSQPANTPKATGAKKQDNCTAFIQQLDSECSITQAGTS